MLDNVVRTNLICFEKMKSAKKKKRSIRASSVLLLERSSMNNSNISWNQFCDLILLSSLNGLGLMIVSNVMENEKIFILSRSAFHHDSFVEIFRHSENLFFFHSEVSWKLDLCYPYDKLPISKLERFEEKLVELPNDCFH